MANPAASSQKGSPIPPDNPQRKLSVANSESAKMRHLSVGGGTYTILLTGKETAGRYCLIDMHVPPGAGPPPHRHDFEEMFTVLDGEIELTFRGKKSTASAGDTVNIPANAPHWFKNIPRRQHACSACARPLGRKNSSWRLPTRSTAVPHRHPSSPRKNKGSG